MVAPAASPRGCPARSGVHPRVAGYGAL